MLKPMAVATKLKSTRTYSTAPTQYLPYPFNAGKLVLDSTDDKWSELVNLPFEFCFFGKKYSSCVIGANGNISFDMSLANQPEPYPVHPAPFNGPCYNNCIMGPFYDLNPAKGGRIRYATYGVAPCRTFVVSWNEVPLYDCPDLKGTHQIVMYESTYAIDIFIGLRPICATWQSGNGVLGIQNENATMAYTFPGKNCAPWYDSAMGYRFAPNAMPDMVYKWIDLKTGMALAGADSNLVCPADTNKYVFEVTFTTQCDVITTSDTVSVNVLTIPSVADFTYEVRYGCDGDTVRFTNNSVFSGTQVSNEGFLWDFGDRKKDTVRHPLHVFKPSGTYTVILTTKGTGVCEDTAMRTIKTEHDLRSYFSMDEDSFCASGTVTFADASTVTPLYGNPATVNWIFGDGNISNLRNPVHHYVNPGVFTVLQIVGNSVPCYDTSYATVVVDSIPYISFIRSDSAVCEGGSVTFRASHSTCGFRQLLWFAGNSEGKRGDSVITISFDTVGIIKIKAVAKYAICPDTSATDSILVKPYPDINLGKDTTICPGASRMWLADTNTYASKVKRVWNTFDTSAGIWVQHPGNYFLQVTVDGCSSTDSINITKSCFINIPNSFSPNGDGENETFIPLQLLSGGVKAYHLLIFNRWGQTIYEGTNVSGTGWDGTFNGVPQPFGVYVYVLDVEFKNGVKEHYHGNITLLR